MFSNPADNSAGLKLTLSSKFATKLSYPPRQDGPTCMYHISDCYFNVRVTRSVILSWPRRPLPAFTPWVILPPSLGIIGLRLQMGQGSAWIRTGRAVSNLKYICQFQFSCLEDIYEGSVSKEGRKEERTSGSVSKKTKI